MSPIINKQVRQSATVGSKTGRVSYRPVVEETSGVDDATGAEFFTQVAFMMETADGKIVGPDSPVFACTVKGCIGVWSEAAIRYCARCQSALCPRHIHTVDDKGLCRRHAWLRWLREVFTVQ